MCGGVYRGWQYAAEFGRVLRAVGKRSASQDSHRLWPARLSIALVLGWNVQCALAFALTPAVYAPAFELQGVGGDVLVRSLGILFLMWNVPYVVALWHPLRQRTALMEAIVMQGIGLVGESLLLWRLPNGHLALRMTAQRFILFDAAGLLALLMALWIVRREQGRYWGQSRKVASE